MNILDDVKRILAQPFECRKTSLPDGALHNVQKELENMINAIHYCPVKAGKSVFEIVET